MATARLIDQGWPGRVLHVGDYTATETKTHWIITRAGAPVGKMFDGEAYGGRPHCSMRELVWSGPCPKGASSPKSPDYGMCFDIGPHDTYAEALAAFAKAADRLIAWRVTHAGKGV